MKKVFAFLTLLSMLTACAGQDQLNQAKKLLDEQKYPEAEAAYEKLTSADAKNAEAWNGLGNAQLQNGKVDAAIASYGKSVAIAKEAGKDPNLARYCFDRGLLLYAQAQYDNARDDFQTAANGSYKLGESYAYLGVIAGQTGDDLTALNFLNQAVKADPQNHFAWSNRGYYNSKVGDNKTAIYDLGKAIEIKPDDKVSYLNRGYTYIGMGDFVNALKDIDKALELDPDYLGAIAYKGIALTNSNRPAEALPWLDRSVAMQPDNAAFYYYRGAARISVGMIDSACSDLRRAEAGGHMDGVSMREQYCK